MNSINVLKNNLSEENIAKLYSSMIVKYDEITLECSASQYKALLLELKNNPLFKFEELIDLCGVDYLEYKNLFRTQKRFAVVCHLLSIVNNVRIRVRTFADDDALPVIDSICDIYNAASWYERETFDMYGIVFSAHPDLRRILTDYGFIGHPLRKDFPVSGYMEMVYDEKQQKIIYQPVTIEPRNNVPRIVREENYGK